LYNFRTKKTHETFHRVPFRGKNIIWKGNLSSYRDLFFYLHKIVDQESGYTWLYNNVEPMFALFTLT